MAAILEINSNEKFTEKERWNDHESRPVKVQGGVAVIHPNGDQDYPHVNLPQIPPPIPYSLPKSSTYHEPARSNSKSLDSIDLEAQSDAVRRIRFEALNPHLNPNEPAQNPPEGDDKFTMRLRGGCCCDCLYSLLRCLLCCCIFEAICDFCC